MSVRFLGPARASCGDHAGFLRLLQESMNILGQNDNLKSCVVLTITVRCPYGDRPMLLSAMRLQATGLRFCFSNLP